MEVYNPHNSATSAKANFEGWVSGCKHRAGRSNTKPVIDAIKKYYTISMLPMLVWVLLLWWYITKFY